MHVQFAILVAMSLLLAGCASRGKEDEADDSKPQYRIYNLYLYPLVNASRDLRWELYPGAKVEAWAFAPEPDATKATIPGPEIRAREGDTVQITFEFAPGTMAHTIHWHGLHVPWDQDGVPYLTQSPLGDAMGGGNGSRTYTYIFKVNQSGTYWYHCHVDTLHHLDMGMYGPFIVEPADPKADPAFDQEKTILLDEWDKSHIHTNPQPDQLVAPSGDPEDTADAAYGQVRDYYHMGVVPKVEEAVMNVRDTAPSPLKEQLPHSLLRKERDWYPVTYPPYYPTYDTFLMNGKAFPLTEPILVEPGKTLRIRLIHAGSLVHSMHLHGHHFLVTHKDGFKLPAPYWADTLLLGPGERYDLYVKLDNPGPWMFHDHMPQFETNDNIHPGGIMTVVCYTSGWAHADACGAGGHQHGAPAASGEITEAMTRLFASTQGAPVSSSYIGIS